MTTSRISGNYFAHRTYVKSDAATGLLSTRQGNRLLAVPEVLLRSIHQALRAETGQAAPLALYTCGFWWGGSFYDRVRSEVESYYNTTIAQMNAVEFLVMMRQVWAVHGFGSLTLDFSHREHGFIQVTTENSAMALGSELGVEEGQLPSHHLEAGFIAAWFSRWAGKNLRACATDLGVSSGMNTEPNAKRNQFLVGLASQIEQAETWVKQGISSTEILQRFAAESNHKLTSTKVGKKATSHRII